MNPTDTEASAVAPTTSPSSTELAKQRTQLAGTRNTLAQERTSLAHHRTHLANERTHLAYLRTSVSLAGFGITLNRFAIYLINNSKVTGADASLTALRDVKHIGLAMVVLGILVAIWALFRYARASRDIDRNLRHRDWPEVAVVTVLFIVLGAGVALWLFIR
ncbi:hypothetical protein GCM10011487_23340 [Steroidobacter agaridevorans]|uniref:DUF202 domain-containing protein n=1 Tax=Steroidobacter agaridevorans TaxID=2695856 RepID=A0A829YAG3_9GAMM|nr:DUF202 domain-containing protein [Steroidobacter agaridevorans]GFE80334.1 hypothetical protein GCM10011487_23340 [Steroidobacter agaridevorans]GFE87387.1 hypothetical protein GCM10011488_23410 [Steroidobacter agaridevorans]